jgi:uncharacterized protein YndB with AHSA1/START domain
VTTPDLIHMLHIERHLEAPRGRVFDAWTDPEKIRIWFGGPEVLVESAAVDLRIGGQYTISVRERDGSTTLVTGRYLEIRPPEKLVYTWKMSTPEVDSPESTVTVEFHDEGERTRLVLEHGPFPDPDQRLLHREGWIACLEGLATLL